ncbi:MAG TPA: DNA double-strand break repair nuclease NurA [Candidatus Nanopusillus sp.]|nr:DNA double-strand break repair nuclease NurA [Candidatus Nanopusillus sp.]
MFCIKIIPLTYWIEEKFEEIKKFLESAHPIFSKSVSNEIEAIIRLYPDIYREIKEKMLDKSIELAKDAKNKIRELREEILNKIEIKKVRRTQDFMNKPVIGCDTSSNILPISNVKIYAISGVSIFVKDRDIKDIKSLTDIIDSKRIVDLFNGTLESDFLEETISDADIEFEDVELRFVVSVIREAYLCELARKHLEELIDKGEDVYAIIIDGPFSISQWHDRVPGEVGKKAVKRLIDARNNLMDTCKKTDTLALGVVKRGRGRYIHHLLNIAEKSDFSDQVLFHQILNYCERTETFNITEGIRKWRMRNELKKYKRSIIFEEKLKIKEKELEDKVKSDNLLINRLKYDILGFFIKTSPDELTQPIRIEFPEYLKDREDEIASFVISTSVRCRNPAYIDGLPFAVAISHMKTKLSSILMREIYGHTLAKIYQDFRDLKLLPPEWGERPW